MCYACRILGFNNGTEFSLKAGSSIPPHEAFNATNTTVNIAAYATATYTRTTTTHAALYKRTCRAEGCSNASDIPAGKLCS